MPDRHLPGQRAQLLLVEHLGDEAAVAQRGDVTVVGDGDTGRLLSSVLERVEREVAESGYLGPRRVHAEDSALIARAVAVIYKGIVEWGHSKELGTASS